MGVVFGQLLDIWNLFLRLLGWYSNNQSHWSKSGICCRLQTSFLRVDGCCCISVHVPTSFCCCEMQPVVLEDEKCQSVFFMTLPRECFVLCCKTVERKSRKSGDLLQTREFTSGDKVTHFCFLVTALGVVACVLLHTCSFVSRIHVSARLREGFLFWTLSDEKHSILARSVFVSHGHRLCRDNVVVLIASIAIWIPVIYFSLSEPGNWRSTGSEIRCIPYQDGREKREGVKRSTVILKFRE